MGADDDEDFTDVARESSLARWSSLAAPLLPSLLLSRETASTLFATPWRGAGSPVLRARSAALHVLDIFEYDLASQESWLRYGLASVGAAFRLSPAELICWTYSFVFLLATLSGASSVASLLGLGGLIRRLYVLGAAKSFVSFVYDVMLLADAGLSRAGLNLLRAKARSFALASVASWLLPGDVLATHLALCLIFGFVERALVCISRLGQPALTALLSVRTTVLAATRRPPRALMQGSSPLAVDDASLRFPRAASRSPSERDSDDSDSA